jgi:hypothetical protein
MSNEVRRYAIALSLAAALAGSAQLVAAQGRHLETARPTPQIAACDILVDVNTGETFHVEKTAASPLSAGSSLTLSGTTYTVTGFGPVYHLEDGTVLQASGTGSNTLQGQQWTEIYPDAGRVLSSSGWNDKDGDGALSPGDTLTLDGRTVRVNAVRLHVDVVPAVHP